MLALWKTTFSGFVPCRILGKLTVCGQQYVRVRITARQARNFAIGEVHAVPFRDMRARPVRRVRGAPFKAYGVAPDISSVPEV